ncbi:MAG: hypothetical protein L0Z50_19235 [Verrucomicrobiales bacterium]|nr:hypothetical protein [Verrucomicrobiales bacterium]
MKAWKTTSSCPSTPLRSATRALLLFRLGRIVATPNALATLSEQDISTVIQRHQAGDWGDLDDEDQQANNDALSRGSRLFSAYHSGHGVKFRIITEADRSVTTVLMPEDY